MRVKRASVVAAWMWVVACGETEESPVACSTIACVSGAHVRGHLALDFAAIQASRIEVCRNDACYSGAFDTSVEPPEPGAGVVLTLPDYGDRPEQRDVEQTPLVQVTVWNEGGKNLELRWRPWSDADLSDGDRYRMTLIAEDGERLVVFDERGARYEQRTLGEGACQQQCRAVELTF